MLRLSSAVRSLDRVYLCVLLSSGVLFAGREIPSAPGDPVVPNEIIVKLRPGARTAVISALAGTDVAVAASNRKDIHLFRAKGGFSQAKIEALARRSDVVFVERNHVRTTQLVAPNDSNFASQWALATVRALDAWNLVPGTAAVPATRIRIAVLDTGTDCTHTDFKGVSGSVDSASGGQLNMTNSAALVPTTVSTPACAWQDDNGHGTHVAGTIAATTWNSTGVASLGYPLEIMTYKVLGSSGSGSDYSIAMAIMTAADAGARIVSMSLSGPGYSQTLQDAIDYAWQRNVLVVAAAGNSNTGALHFPAGGNHVVAVAATDSTGARATYSNYGISLAIAAPGSGILSTYPMYKGGYATMSGTSMATPHVSALAGLIAAISPGAASESILLRIQQTAQGNTGWNQMLGYGIINAFGAISGLATSAPAGSIVGQVMSSGDWPYTGATVSAGGRTVTTNEAGVFRISGLAPGTYFMSVNAAAAGSATQAVNVIAGADSPVTVRVGTPTGLVRGTITSGGSPVPGAVAYVMAGGLKIAAAIAGATGDFELSAPAGTYELRGSALGFAEVTAGTLTLTGGDQVSRNVMLSRYGTIQGTARDASGVPLANVTLSLSGPVLAGAVSTGTGQLSTIGLPPGQYVATCAAKDQVAPDPFTVTVANGAATAADCQFGTPTLTVTPSTAFVNSGGQLRFTALLNAAQTSAVTWSRSPSIGTVDSTGLFTAPAGLTANQTVTITAASTAVPGLSASTAVTTGPAIVLALSPSAVIGGNPVTGSRIRLGEPAPAGGLTVTLTSSSPQTAAPPASLTIPTGSTESNPFTIATTAVAGPASVVITAAFSGGSAAAVLTVTPAGLSSLSFTTGSLTAGAVGSGQVNLTGQAPAGGAVVSLVSSNPAVLSVPSDLTVPAGQSWAGFSVTAWPVSVPATVVITATQAGVTKSSTLTVLPVDLQSVSLSLSAIPSGSTQAGNRITLAGPAPAGGLTVALSTVNSAITIPSAVVVPQGASSAYFTLTAAPVDAPLPISLTATLNGVVKSVAATIVPATLSQITFPTRITGGIAFTGSVSLVGVTGPSGASVAIASANPATVAVPATVFIPAGRSSAIFRISVAAVAAETAVPVTAKMGGSARSLSMTVLPPVISVLYLSGSTVKGGSVTTMNQVYLNAAAPAGGLNVSLTSGNGALVKVPASVTVLAGQRFAPFTISTSQVTADTRVAITAASGGITKSATLTLTP